MSLLLFFAHSLALASGYEDLSQIAIQLLQKYPPEQTLFIGLGRSPTPLMAFFQNLKPDLAVTVPLSRVKFINLRSYEREAANAHIERYLPKRESIGNKKLVIMDYSLTGEGIETFLKIFENYAHDRDLKNSVQAVVLADDNAHTVSVSTSYPLEYIHMHDYEDLNYQNKAAYFDDYAEYGKAYLSEKLKDRSKRPVREQYLRFKRQMKSLFMQKDERLEAWVKTQHPELLPELKHRECVSMLEGLIDLFKDYAWRTLR